MSPRACERGPRRWQPGYPGPRRYPAPTAIPPNVPPPTGRPEPVKLTETFEGDPSSFSGGGWE